MTSEITALSAPVVHSRRCFGMCGDGAFGQLLRFALVGGMSNILYVGIFVLVHSEGSILANAVGAVASTILANELHRRLTFHAVDRVGWFTAQWEGGGLALVGLGVSTAAITTLNMTFPDLGAVLTALVLVAVTAVVGGLRFLALRGWVF